jgi:hypothetical protein
MRFATQIEHSCPVHYKGKWSVHRQCTTLVTFIGFMLVLVKGWQDGIFTRRGDRLNYPSLCIVARTYRNADKGMLLAFLHSLRAQSYQDFEVWLLDTENPNEGSFHHEVDKMDDARFKVKTYDVSTAYGTSYGYITTEAAVQELLMFSHNFKYLLVTNGDNLYQHDFLKKTVTAFSENNPRPCIVATYFISRYGNTHIGPNQLMKTRFVRDRVDLGAAVTDLYAVDRAYSDEVFEKNNFTADYFYFEKIIRVSGWNCAAIIPEVLFTHQ